MKGRAFARFTQMAVIGFAGFPALTLAQTAAENVLIRVTEGQLSGSADGVLASEPVNRLVSDPSVSLSRMGGRGLEPVVRGQSQERVDVLLDGIRVEGACPNRMDPPTSRLSSALAPVLEVRTNNRTLRWGPIAGGQIVATTADPQFDGNATTGQVTIGGSDNGNGRLINATAAVGSESAWLRLSGGYDEADDYEDGDGNEVRSAYENTEGRIDGAWTAGNGFFIKGMVSRQEEDDVKYAGSGMDAPQTDTDMYRIELGSPVAGGEWSLLAWQADVDHIMDNFSLRSAGMMKMQTDSTTETRGVRFTLDQSPNNSTDWAVGADLETNDWDATLSNVTNPVPMTASLMWPGVERERVGLFAEGFRRVARNLKVGAGVRFDRVEMDATRADEVASMGMTPSMLYQNAYGTTDIKPEDNNVSGFVSGEWRLPHNQALTLTASRSVRSPSVTERYLARNTSSGSWIGNPGLDTEKHHKAELALSGSKNQWSWKPVIWVDQVDDFVRRYEETPADVRYENIDARLLGVEMMIGWTDGTWSSSSTLASVRGENRDNNQSLAQIPPVQFVQTLGWHHMGHSIEAQWQLARRQDRIDAESGLDAGTSPGYGVFSLSGSHPLMEHLTFSWALDNLFDNTWAPHVSRANTDPFNPDAVRVNEPGRTLRAALTAKW